MTGFNQTGKPVLYCFRHTRPRGLMRKVSDQSGLSCPTMTSAFLSFPFVWFEKQKQKQNKKKQIVWLVYDGEDEDGDRDDDDAIIQRAMVLGRTLHERIRPLRLVPKLRFVSSSHQPLCPSPSSPHPRHRLRKLSVQRGYGRWWIWRCSQHRYLLCGDRCHG